MVIDKKKQKEDVVQDKEVFLHKLYNILSEPSILETLEPIFIQEEVKNLEKALKMLQSSTKTISFLPPPHYKAL